MRQAEQRATRNPTRPGTGNAAIAQVARGGHDLDNLRAQANASRPVAQLRALQGTVLQRRHQGHQGGQRRQGTRLNIDWRTDLGIGTAELRRSPEAGEADAKWSIELFGPGNHYIGHIFVIYHAGAGRLQPDGLEVESIDQSGGYGATLSKLAVEAVAYLRQTQAGINADHIYLNLVSPLSAHISLKQLTIQLNGEDAMDETAVGHARAAVAALPARGEDEAEPKYDKDHFNPAQFANFWGRLVQLVRKNDVKVDLPGIGTLETGYKSTAADAVRVLAFLRKAKTGTFGMNVRAPIPED